MSALRLPSRLTTAWLLLVASGSLSCQKEAKSPGPIEPALAVVEALAAPRNEEFLRADGVRPFRFPEDHGPHRGFRTEWWYWTGTLEDASRNLYGFQLTFFRQQLTARPRPRAAALATSEIWMAHAAVGSERDLRFLFAERFSRQAAVQVRAAPFELTMGTWSARSLGGDFAPLQLAAGGEGFSFDLQLLPGRGPVLQGEQGLSRKGPEPGNASYYYSMTRFPVTGTIELDGKAVPVSGRAWLDREWSTSVLPRDVVGWDWLALQLDDGRDLMLYRLRRADGSSTGESAGSWILPDGTVRSLSRSDFELQPLGEIETASRTRYPAGFEVVLPGDRTVLEIDPILPDQELRTAIRYWEGAVRVRGTGPAGTIFGSGFLEMTGYAGRKSGSRSPDQPGKSSAFGSTPR